MLSFKEGNEKGPVLVGPWGGQGGVPWDDGVYSTVRQIVITHGTAIDSIRIEYDRKGTSLWSVKHGGNGGAKTDKVPLDHPTEILTTVSGHFGSMTNGSPIIIRSLTFHSNYSKYGPFGLEQGTQFSCPINGAKIVGFHGRSGWYVDSIGFYMKHIKNPSPWKSLVPSRTLSTSSNDVAGYTVMEGSVGKGFDIVLAVRERGDNLPVISKKFTREPSSVPEYAEAGLVNKIVACPSLSGDNGLPNLGAVTYGPWGGTGGTIFDDGIYTGVRQIHLSRNVGITSMKVLYDKNGQEVWGNRHGGSGGLKFDKIIFDYPFEILTSVTGYFGTTMLMGPIAIKSLTFHTTKKKYGPFGEQQGTFFSSVLADGMIVGFHGRSGWYIDSIGVHVLEGKVSPPESPPAGYPWKGSGMGISEIDNPQWSNKIVLSRGVTGEEVTYGIVKDPVPSGPGPWGGEGGKPWDDGVYLGVKQIFITRGDAICSIQIEYDRSGQSVWSSRHGSTGQITHRVKFEYPNEVLNCVSGYYNSIGGNTGQKVISSITLYTSRGKYGPIGEELGTYFTSITTEGKVVGFHGRSGMYLDAIGVHMQHWLGDRRSSKSIFSKFLF
ncbi:Mannose-binding lectins domain-containing protein [Dioscorea alata]|uniref:Mannose-binding lectins domain-containing protein n=1 Tax=Dioscorea alata TaxID=55571 RepID=A0ACB7VI41_DIOAL|nr:Mannose-binding lectins domain-containing protein [Dioscorea alata]